MIDFMYVGYIAKLIMNVYYKRIVFVRLPVHWTAILSPRA